MFIFVFFLVVAIAQFATNKILNISDGNSVGYQYSKRDALILVGIFGLGVLFQVLPLKGHKIFWVLLGLYAFGILITMVILATIKKVIVAKQREELLAVFGVLEPVISNDSKVKNKETGEFELKDINNPPFQLGYEGTKINKITIKINPNTFKEQVAVNLCLSLNKYLPNYEWVNEFDFAARECAFVGTPLPPHIAKYKGSWLRPPEFIPIGLSGLGEVSWNLNSIKNEGRSNYIYEDGKIAKTVDTPSAPQALCVGSPLGLNTIVPTTKGYKTIKTIEVGDEVFGYGNKPVKVLAVYEIHESNKLYKFTLEAMSQYSDDSIVLYADDVHKLAILRKDKICPVTASEVKSGDIIPGNLTDYLISDVKVVKNKSVRCFMINSDNHLFLFTDTKNNKWNGGESYPFDAAYIYQTGGGKAIYIDQSVEVQSDEV